MPYLQRFHVLKRKILNSLEQYGSQEYGSSGIISPGKALKLNTCYSLQISHSRPHPQTMGGVLLL